ncbi:hypothetical protein Glove_58g28 [Diversispora epigaea]|uniref:Uncharacterized protein n=1 Tax=Diversispora epigaea TaxID=1348612 RepID=A0A397JN45_9GLOM|nr:hypothetical protein Glove_58g28 [Diversispora epigaea]
MKLNILTEILVFGIVNALILSSLKGILFAKSLFKVRTTGQDYEASSSLSSISTMTTNNTNTTTTINQQYKTIKNKNTNDFNEK